MKNVLVLHGPNLNLLGERPGDDPSLTLDALNHRLQTRAEALGITLRTFQSNHEGELIDRLHAERRWADGILLSPDALAHTSYVLREAVVAVGKRTVEVHLTDIRRRESWRRKSVLKDVCEAQLIGKGVDSYLSALERLAGDVSPAKGKRRAAASTGSASVRGRGSPTLESTAAQSASAGREPRAEARKTLGRAPAREATSDAIAEGSRKSEARKTLGREATSNVMATRSGGARPATDFLTRALVRQKIAERLSGKLTPVALASWARTQWNKVQEGAPAEAGHRDTLEDALQTLTLSTAAASRLSDEQLVDLMAQLEG